MKIDICGNPEGRKILLLPGTCCLWQTNFERLVPCLEKDYQLLCVNYTGFDHSSEIFSSMTEETEKIENAVIKQFGGKLDLVYGSSLGGSFVGLLVQRNRISIAHAVIGSSDLDQMDRISGWFYSKFVTAFLMKMVKNPDDNKQFVDMLQEKMGMDLGENGENYLKDYFRTLKSCDRRSVFNQFYSDLVTPLQKSIYTPGCRVHIMYAKRMGSKYLKRYRKHFADPDIHEFDMGHEGWLFDGELMKREFEKYIQDSMEKKAMKFDITKPIELKKGLYQLNKNAEFNFQLNRLVNMDGADLQSVRKIAGSIHDNASWKSVLLGEAKKFDEAHDVKNAGAFYRMAEFYMEWDDPDALSAWKRARELFFDYYAGYFEGENPVVEQFLVPYDGYEMPCMKLNPCHPAAFSFTKKIKGTIVMNGGFDSSYEEFFPVMEYLRENGYLVYLFEGPGQGACMRLHNAPLTLEWEKPVKAILDYFDLADVCLIGASLGGYYSPRAAAFESRISSFVSWPAFPSLRANIDAAFKLTWPVGKFLIKHFHGGIDRIYENAVRKSKFGGMTEFLKVYYHRLGCSGILELLKKFEEMDMAPFGARITQDVLLLGAAKDDIVYPQICREQKAAMPNARSVRVRILTDKDEASDHCNCGNLKLAMDVVLKWLATVPKGTCTSGALKH